MIRFPIIRNKRNITRASVVACITCALLFIGYLALFRPQPFSDEIALTRTELPSEKVEDRLYIVTSQKSNEKFLMAADGEVVDGAEYSVEEIHRNPFWNPVSCSRIPFVRQGNVLYFLEMVRVPEGDSYREDYQMRVFDISTKTLVSYSLGVYTVGFVYQDEEGVYVVTGKIDGTKPTVLAVYGFDARNAQMYLRDVFDMQPYEMLMAFYKKTDGRFVVSFYDKAMRLRELVYAEHQLKDATITKDENIYFEGDAFKVFDVRASAYLRKQSLPDFSHVQIVERDTSRTVVDFNADGVHKYILTEI